MECLAILSSSSPLISSIDVCLLCYHGCIVLRNGSTSFSCSILMYLYLPCLETLIVLCDLYIFLNLVDRLQLGEEEGALMMACSSQCRIEVER